MRSEDIGDRIGDALDDQPTRELREQLGERGEAERAGKPRKPGDPTAEEVRRFREAGSR